MNKVKRNLNRIAITVTALFGGVVALNNSVMLTKNFQKNEVLASGYETKTLDDVIKLAEEDSRISFGLDPSLTYSIKASSAQDLEDFITKALPTTDLFAATNGYNGVNVFDKEYIPMDVLNELVKQENSNEDYVYNLVPSIVKDGMTEEEALKKVCYYYAKNFPYDKELSPEDCDEARLSRAQGMTYMLKNGVTVCAGYSKALLSSAKLIPFNKETKLVDWNTDKPVYLNPKIVDVYGYHEWVSIKSLNGTNYHYDVTLMGSMGNLSDNYFRMTDEQIARNPFYSSNGQIVTSK